MRGDPLGMCLCVGDPLAGVVMCRGPLAGVVMCRGPLAGFPGYQVSNKCVCLFFFPGSVPLAHIRRKHEALCCVHTVVGEKL